jgi:hypothetical protein
MGDVVNFATTEVLAQNRQCCHRPKPDPDPHSTDIFNVGGAIVTKLLRRQQAARLPNDIPEGFTAWNRSVMVQGRDSSPIPPMTERPMEAGIPSQLHHRDAPGQQPLLNFDLSGRRFCEQQSSFSDQPEYQLLEPVSLPIVLYISEAG